ncbi:MAG: OB-fold nucleic acid binding domain-containing protein [Candidatus Thermoplasmatota archaeon]
MDGRIEKYYNQIKDLKNKEEFLKEIKKRQKEYNYLLDDKTIALIILDELGRNKGNISKINDLKIGGDYTVKGKITKIGQIRTFKRKKGSEGRVANLELKDETGRCKLVLWDRDVDIIDKQKIRVGTPVKVINGYTKKGYHGGIEINIGRWSLLKSEEKKDRKNKTKRRTEDQIEGKIEKIEPTKPFFKENGEYGFLTRIHLNNNGKIEKICLWDEKVKEIQKFKPGDQIKIKSFDIKIEKHKEEKHLNGRAKITKIQHPS